MEYSHNNACAADVDRERYLPEDNSEESVSLFGNSEEVWDNHRVEGDKVTLSN